jgi:peptidoglycan/xylan/chitin deacetylase (PgdA/CDA1 family)
MRHLAIGLSCLAIIGGSVTALAGECPGNPNALGTSRVLAISPDEFSRIGSMQYKQTLPLADHEVVITFDDGPIPPYSNIILDTLASQCVKVTYFLVGEMAHAYPAIVRRMFNEGHTLGTHSQDHPLGFERLGQARVEREIGGGIASVDAALGDPKALAPFFRIPGLGRSNTVETYTSEQHLVVWSADVVADDWFRHIGADQIAKRAIRRLEEKGRGILLLHDIHPATAMALPTILKELKERGYHVVQVVAAGERPTTLPETMIASPTPDKEAWPRILKVNAASISGAAKDEPALRHRVRRALASKHRGTKLAGATEPDYVNQNRNWQLSQF